VSNQKIETRTIRELCEALNLLESPDEFRRFLTDLCTPMELVAMADRWRVAKQLAREVPYRRIYEKTGVSTATVTRVARSMTRGEGGYMLLINRLGRQVGRHEDESKSVTKEGDLES
jgi:TrpR-related protein YerC/YecD